MNTYTNILAAALTALTLNVNAADAGQDLNSEELYGASVYSGTTVVQNSTAPQAIVDFQSTELYGEDVINFGPAMDMAGINATLENNPTAAGGTPVVDVGFNLNSDEPYHQ